MLQEVLPWGNDCYDLHTMLDGLLIVIGNGLSTVFLHVLIMGVEPTLELGELGFENEVQDILGCRTRCVKINCPSVGFVWSQLCKKNLLKGKFAAEPDEHHCYCKNRWNLYFRASQNPQFIGFKLRIRVGLKNPGTCLKGR